MKRLEMKISEKAGTWPTKTKTDGSHSMSSECFSKRCSKEEKTEVETMVQKEEME